ncbi:M56 family metallopeptidase [Paenibacillus barengoltzii]
MIFAVIADTFTNHVLWELVLNILILFSLTMFLKNMLEQLRRYKLWRQYIKANSGTSRQDFLDSRFENERVAFVIIKKPEIIAMTAGFFKPKIVLSSGALERFGEEELAAIVYHELFHYKSRHPLQLFILKLLADCLAFLPVVEELARHYKVWMELLADRYSMKRMGSEAPMAQVLLSLLQKERFVEGSFGVGFANEAINYRLMQLIEPGRKIKIPLFNWGKMALSLFVLLTIVMIFLIGCVKFRLH